MSGNDDQNLFDLPENVINYLQKSELINKILELKGRVTIDVDFCGLCKQIKNLTEILTNMI